MLHYEELKIYLEKLGKVIVAFSGGIDSYFVLKAAIDSLGRDNVLAVTGDSPSLKQSEKEQTRLLADLVGARHRIIITDELEDPNYYNNPSNRCFFCKDELYSKLEAMKDELGYNAILDGTNYDDISDYRPGYKAAKNHNINSPLAELKFTKKEIREISKTLELEIWDKPSSPCLSSRIPCGQIVTIEKLSTVEKAEEVLKQFGFREYRVRHFEFSANGLVEENGNGSEKLKLAKLDISKVEFEKLFEPGVFADINGILKNLGYNYVTIDMGGLKSGSMNVGVNLKMDSRLRGNDMQD
jgi:uncharacterized protein